MFKEVSQNNNQSNPIQSGNNTKEIPSTPEPDVHHPVALTLTIYPAAAVAVAAVAAAVAAVAV